MNIGDASTSTGFEFRVTDFGGHGYTLNQFGLEVIERLSKIALPSNTIASLNTNASTDRKVLESAYKRLENISGLGENWDSYGGKAPIEMSLEAAALCLRAIESGLSKFVSIASAPSFSPAPDGVVGFEWNIDGRDLFVRFNSSSSVEYYLEDENDPNFSVSVDEDYQYICQILGWLLLGQKHVA